MVILTTHLEYKGCSLAMLGLLQFTSEFTQLRLLKIQPASTQPARAGQEDHDSTFPSCYWTSSRTLLPPDSQHPEMQVPGQRLPEGLELGLSSCSRLPLQPGDDADPLTSYFCVRQLFSHLLNVLSSTLHVWERKPCSGTALGWLQTPLGCSPCQGCSVIQAVRWQSWGLHLLALLPVVDSQKGRCSCSLPGK